MKPRRNVGPRRADHVRQRLLADFAINGSGFSSLPSSPAARADQRRFTQIDGSSQDGSRFDAMVRPRNTLNSSANVDCSSITRRMAAFSRRTITKSMIVVAVATPVPLLPPASFPKIRSHLHCNDSFLASLRNDRDLYLAGLKEEDRIGEVSPGRRRYTLPGTHECCRHRRP